MARLTVSVNGDPVELEAGASVSDLLEHLRVGSPRVAVERNRDIVPRARYAETVLAEGDALEVVELVGGG